LLGSVAGDPSGPHPPGRRRARAARPARGARRGAGRHAADLPAPPAGGGGGFSGAGRAPRRGPWGGVGPPPGGRAPRRGAAEDARHAREELERLHDELRLADEGLERRMAEMQKLNRDLRSLDEMKSNLLANVSHELQTPLVSIKGFTEMILKGRLGGVT